MRRAAVTSLSLSVSLSVALGLFAGRGLTACSSSSSSSNGANDAGGDANAGGGFALEVPCTDVDDAVYGDPGPLPAPSADLRGQIVHCAKEPDITQAALQADATRVGYTGRPLTSGAHVYRVLYRTERGNDPASPGVSSAVVFVPDAPRAPKLPLIVVSHGSVGQAPNCAATKPHDGYPVAGTIVEQAYPLVGAGFAVIAPDLAGYAGYGAPGNPPSAYSDAQDVGKSTLDGTRALARMFPSSVTDKVIIVGHSQGGGTALAALAVSTDYGAGGTVVGTVAYSPLWFNPSTWGAVFAIADKYPMASNPVPTAVGVYYTYTHGELLDGPGHGVDAFAADKRAAIKHFVDNTCYGDSYPELNALGTLITDLYDPTYVDAVKYAAAIGSPCTNDLCSKWMARYADDRPHLTGAAAAAPLLVLYGGKDTAIPPSRATCGFERLKSDGANTTFCFDPDQTHGGIVHAHADYVSDWIANLTVGAPAPAPCAADLSALVDDAGAPITCATPPPN